MEASMPSTPGESDGEAVDHRKGPRRRGEVLRTAIFDAALAELAEVGYARLAIERIAARAHTSKASVYKRWPSRAELVVAALQHGLPAEPDPVPDTGSLREDVLALLRAGAGLLDGLFGEAVRGLMVETLTDPERTARMRAGMFTSRDNIMRQILERAAARGDIPVTAITPLRIRFAPVLVDHQFLIYGAPIPDDLLCRIVDDLLLPLLASPAGGAGEHPPVHP
jgi:AcrR family transcriptional regulator